jgi:hypothetical protein
MRSELFAQIKKNKKQYYRELRNEKVNHLQKLEQVKDEVSKRNFKNENPIAGIDRKKDLVTSKPKNNNQQKNELNLKVQQVTFGLIERLRNGFFDVCSKLPGSIKNEFTVAGREVRQIMNPAILKLRNEYNRLSFAIGGRVELVANYAIDNINNLGTVIFEVDEEQQPAQLKHNTRQWDVEEAEVKNTSEWIWKLVLSLPIKLRKTITNLLIYLESDFLVINTKKDQYLEQNKKSIFFNPITTRVKKLKKISFSKKRADSENTSQDASADSAKDLKQRTGFAHILKYSKKQLHKHLFPLINKFL